jgi:hypothetical protein
MLLVVATLDFWSSACCLHDLQEIELIEKAFKNNFSSSLK